jgi:hypothetical protein
MTLGISIAILAVLIGVNLWYLYKQKKDKDFHNFTWKMNSALREEKLKLEEDIEELKIFMQMGYVRLSYINALPHIVVYNKSDERFEVKIYNIENKSFSYCQGEVLELGNTVVRLEETHSDTQHHEAVLKQILMNDNVSFNQISQ